MTMQSATKPAAPSVPLRTIEAVLSTDLLEQLRLLARIATRLSGKEITDDMLITDALEQWVEACAEKGLLEGQQRTAPSHPGGLIREAIGAYFKNWCTPEKS